MTRSRRFASALWLALALVAGQQAAALHDLGHATGQLTQKHDSKPAPSKCDQCFACAELSGAVGATPLGLPIVSTGGRSFSFVFERASSCATRLAFRSRAPPALL
jgi:hypothetical protein